MLAIDTEETQQAYDVFMLDVSTFGSVDGDSEYYVRGFPTYDLAKEFARRWVRSCVEDARMAGDPMSWAMYGENASVHGGVRYSGADEVDFFIANPATPEEVDWKAVKLEAGIGSANEF